MSKCRYVKMYQDGPNTYFDVDARGFAREVTEGLAGHGLKHALQISRGERHPFDRTVRVPETSEFVGEVRPGGSIFLRPTRMNEYALRYFLNVGQNVEEEADELGI